MDFLKFFRTASLITLFFIALSFTLVYTDVMVAYFGKVVTWSVLFFLIISSLAFYILKSAMQSQGKGAFVRGVITANLLKILFSLGFAVYLLLAFEQKQLVVIMIFFASYLLYSVFVMTYFFSNLRQISEQHKNAENNNSSR